jgi:beta-lactamase superfamily II metal-dependent hydrolase
MLAFHVLNVGHGSSVVVEFEHGGNRSVGVVDSNANARQTPKAIAKLRQLNADRLSFVVLSHPHKDHFSGLYEIVSQFPGAIDYFYSCPFGDLLHNRARFRTLGEKLRKIWNDTDSMAERSAALELAQILRWASEGVQRGTLEWHECRGESFSLAPTGFSEVKINSILPPARVIANYVQRIAAADMSVIGHFDDNEISLALRFFYKDKCVILGGDGTVSNWEARRRFEQNKSDKLNADVVNLPHHGSRYDCTPEVPSCSHVAETDLA